MFYSFQITDQVRPGFFWTNDFASWSLPGAGGREGGESQPVRLITDKDLWLHCSAGTLQPIEYTLTGWWLDGICWDISCAPAQLCLAQLSSAVFDSVLPGLGRLSKNCFIFGGGGASYSANSQGLFYQSDLFQSKTSSLVSCYTVAPITCKNKPLYLCHQALWHNLNIKQF